MSFFKKLFGSKDKKTETIEQDEPIEAIRPPNLPTHPKRKNVDLSYRLNPKPIAKKAPVRHTSNKVFFVVGTQHYPFEDKVNEHINAHKRKTYQSSMSIREVIEDYGQIYKYSPMTSKRVKLIPEPENEYDNNAIAVHFRNTKIGHIKSSDTELVKKYLDDDKSYKAKILGGPFKELDYDEIVEVNGQFKMEIIFD